MLTVGSLFSGIGGFDLGLQRAGMSIAWQCEIDSYCQRVLQKHWPHIPRIPNVKDVNRSNVSTVDVLCGGFPCLVVSQAARGRNVAVSLWPEFARIIRDLQPRYVIVENVEGLLSRGRGFGDVLGDLAESGFDATWQVLRASNFGAPHHRPRVWLAGYPHGNCQPDMLVDAEVAGMSQFRRDQWSWADSPNGLGMDDGLPGRMDRVRALGNALVPQIAEALGRRIVAHHLASDATSGYASTLPN